MNRYKKLFSNTAILAVGTMASKLLVFFLMPLYTALLSPAEYGTAELITSTANLLIPIACVGISNGIFRFAAERGSDKREVFSSSVFLLLCGLGGFCVLSPLLGFIDLLDGYVWLIVAYVFFADLQAVCAQYIRAIDKTKLFAGQGILNTLCTILFNLLFLLRFDMGVVGYVLAVVCGNVVTLLFLFFAARLWRVFSLRAITKNTVKELLWFSLPLIPTTVCWLITDLSDRYMVTYFCSEAATGIYSAAYKIPTIVNLATGIFMQAWQFSAVAESSDEGTLRTFYGQVYRGFLSLVMIGSVMLILLSEFLAGLLLADAYREAAHYMPTLLCAVAFEAIVSFLATVYLVKKRSKNSFYTAMLGAVLNILLNFLLIPKAGLFGGALGAAIATLIGYGAVLIVRLIDVRRYIHFSICLPRLAVSTLLLLLTATLVTFEIGSYLIAVGVALILVGINLPALIDCAGKLLSRRRAK